jgi:hypothetical protein
MTNINSMFPTKYLKAFDINQLSDSQPTVTLKALKYEDLFNGKMGWVAYFGGWSDPQYESKGLILNRVNARRFEAAFGPESDDWIGKKTQLYIELVDVSGQNQRGNQGTANPPDGPKKGGDARTGRP